MTACLSGKPLKTSEALANISLTPKPSTLSPSRQTALSPKPYRPLLETLKDPLKETKHRTQFNGTLFVLCNLIIDPLKEPQARFPLLNPKP